MEDPPKRQMFPTTHTHPRPLRAPRSGRAGAVACLASHQPDGRAAAAAGEVAVAKAAPGRHRAGDGRGRRPRRKQRALDHSRSTGAAESAVHGQQGELERARRDPRAAERARRARQRRGAHRVGTTDAARAKFGIARVASSSRGLILGLHQVTCAAHQPRGSECTAQWKHGCRARASGKIVMGVGGPHATTTASFDATWCMFTVWERVRGVRPALERQVQATPSRARGEARVFGAQVRHGGSD